MPFEQLIKQADITGTDLYLSQERMLVIIEALEPDKVRYIKLLSQTMTEPDEIWHIEEAAPQSSEQKIMTRTHVIQTFQTLCAMQGTAAELLQLRPRGLAVPCRLGVHRPAQRTAQSRPYCCLNRRSSSSR